MNLPLSTSEPVLEAAAESSLSRENCVCSDSTRMSAVTKIVSLTANPEPLSNTTLDCAKSHHPWDLRFAENL